MTDAGRRDGRSLAMRKDVAPVRAGLQPQDSALVLLTGRVGRVSAPD
jgi:hypothetical protein